VAANLHPLDVLGDPTRRAIFERLRRGPTPVGELARELPVSRPAVSQHLRVLKEAGLVVDNRSGTRRLYAVDPTGVGRLRAWFDLFWDDALAEFKSAVEAEAGADPAATASGSPLRARGRPGPDGLHEADDEQGDRRRARPSR
jgi:DNA-binding transcriptional ArsR family regulator